MEGGGGGGGGGGSAPGGGRGRGVGGSGVILGAARENEKERGGGCRGRSMGRARVCARLCAPHGAGAMLIVGGAIVGAAVFAWFRRRRGGREGAKNLMRQHVKEEEDLDGEVVDDEQDEAQRLHQFYENLSRDIIEDGKATEELHQIQKDDEIVPTELVSELEEKYDHNSVWDCAEITADGMVTESVTENGENSSKNTVENEIIVNDNEGAENSDEHTLSLSSLHIIAVEEHDNHNGAVQDAELTETTPMTESVTHQEQFSEEVKMNTVEETAEVKLAGGTVMEKNEFEQEEEKAKGELVEPISLSAYSSVSSLSKRAGKNNSANPRWNERGMKLEQDCTCTNGELKEHELTKGGAVLTMDRRTSYVAISALMFAVAMGITIYLHTLIRSSASNMIFR
ncbi:hypothetical protein GUJ93_ZPchr0009g1987 [Zizania palustris]|uniref:Uncharacterized protein n=1 Tax=Zizania palustris TaxID=103762 RepID=A0A8J5RGZ8_ZIZPA|nr:hypothetical protein GUJ93_ZPchr0009g1987 [Zizania palustris]KAG8048928.1 hypothetical protein GUJ93_ZPchr0009g1987 [Zizania palustris]